MLVLRFDERQRVVHMSRQADAAAAVAAVSRFNKSAMCKFSASGSVCKFGDQCKFAHSLSDTQQAQVLVVCASSGNLMWWSLFPLC